MTEDDPKTLVSTDWLADHLKDPDLRVLDASWHLPGSDKDAKAEYEAGHILGARFFDIEEISDARSDLPHMAPPVEKFMSRLLSAARVWWLFRLMGQHNVAVLDGGLPKWISEGRPLEDLPPVIRDRHMTVRREAHRVKDVTQVAAASKLGDQEIIDARAPDRFNGSAPEPRPGMRAGHIPGAKNVHFSPLLNADSTMKSPAELRAIFEAAGVDLSKPAITSCGSGVTAAILNLALERIGKRDHALYDGSWAEWGASTTLPISNGET